MINESPMVLRQWDQCCPMVSGRWINVGPMVSGPYDQYRANGIKTVESM